jgi:hypothetical protein
LSYKELFMRIELNIGLNATGRTNTPAACDERAEHALSRLSCAVIESHRYVTTYEGPDGDTTEPGLFVALNTNNYFLTVQSVYMIAALLHQDCISVYAPSLNSGRLVGPRASPWGAFDLDFFHRADAVVLQAAA